MVAEISNRRSRGVALRVLVTGASGFIGRAVIPVLAARHTVLAASRQPIDGLQCEWRRSPELDLEANWTALLSDVDVVVHLAALAHLPLRDSVEAERRVTHINAYSVQALAQQASAAGVRRLVFVSSIKAVGEQSGGEALRPDTLPAPEDAYGHAKRLAENLLLQASAGTRLETVILRPPMVYGPNSKGNFSSLVKYIRLGLPMPFGLVSNRRSIVSVWNLAAVIDQCIDADVAGQTFHVTDERSVSTCELVELIARGLSRSPRLLRISPTVLRSLLVLIGRRHLAQRLLDSLEVDGRLTNERLKWYPEYSTEHDIARAVEQWA